ncbi:MAG: class I SAM-dependent methyltransferase [Candidatus Krumholzibacteria bacterium]|nr:class I SAM-dependent methyltransferase [Candidatus Krumholzibacteria bacterium]
MDLSGDQSFAWLVLELLSKAVDGMLGVIALLFYYVDRLFPRVKVGGRESQQAYSEWEYEVGGELLERYSAHFGSLAGKAVLDIGCGLGGKTVAYSEAGADVVGVDIELQNISQSIIFARSRASGAAFAVGDAEMLPFHDQTFDLVVANDSLEHFPHPEAVLPELARVLRPGGSIFLFFTPWGSPLGSHLYDYIRTPWCHLVFSEGLIEAILEIVLEKRGIGQAKKEAERLIGQFHTELNRITVARYRRILKAAATVETVLEELRPAKFAFLSPLTKLPLVGELFTGTVVGILRKKEVG